MTTSTRTASRSPRLKRLTPSPLTVPAALRDDPSTSAESHPQHFLERVLRCQGPDLDRAMRLYHHSDVVRRLVPELMDNLLPGHQRAAIPLRQQPPSPHIVITRDGSFVTCLGPQMGLGKLPLLPYAPIDHEIAQVELLTGRRKRLESIYAALPPQKLARALHLGPGALTREMVEIIEKDPWAYEVLIYHSYLLATDYIHHWAKLKARCGYQPKLQVEYFKREAVVRQCAFLIGALEGPLTETLEVMLMSAYSPALWEFASAVARKPGRGHVLLRCMEPSGMFAEWVRAAAFDGLLMHCAWYPQEARWIVPKLRGLPPPTAPASWYRDWAVQADSLTPEQCAAGFQATWEDLHPRRHQFERLVPSSPFWDFSIDEVIKWTFLRWPVSRWFPPAELAGEVSRAFREHLRNPPRKDPELKPVKPIVRSAPRVERNAPCPCGSGVKYKRCCGADLPRSEQAATSASVLQQQ